ncbi:hypothetical protein [Ornithinimicrobium kibberense]|uniref:hypothetical protein n=1 Tax=Ornithinimicrobium kibberense TaxID=282060 RepID=UPI00360E7F6D
MSRAPDGEIAGQSVVDAGRKGPLPRHPVGCPRLPGFVGDALLEVVDPVGEPVEVVARLRVLPKHRWNVGQPGQGCGPVGRRGGSGDAPGEGGSGVVGLDQALLAAVPGGLLDHSPRWCAVDPAQRELAAQVRVGRLPGEAGHPLLERLVQIGHALPSEVLLGEDR